MLKVTIGIDMGGTNLKLGLVHEGKLLAKTSVSASSTKPLSDRLDVVKMYINQHAWIKKDSITILAAMDLDYPAVIGMSYLIKQKI